MSQGVLDDWASASGPADDIALLAKSYEALPSHAHRRMFLDAALLLHKHTAQELTAIWAAQLDLDDSHVGDGLVFRGSSWHKRGRGMAADSTYDVRHTRHRQACRRDAASLLDNLVSASLVHLDEGASCRQVDSNVTHLNS
jgi:hypothetical protein